MPIQLGGRKIYIFTGRLSQTVNVCDAQNRQGNYEWKVRLFPPYFVNEVNFGKISGIRSLIKWLKEERQGLIELYPHDDEAETQAINIDKPPVAEDSIWIERAMRITEVCIDELVLEFLRIPYLHRVEHSIHTRMYAILINQPHFDWHFPLAKEGMVTQAIHKEWPESIPRPEKGNRRGNFDLAILSPGQLSNCNLQDFSCGRLAPPIAIEMGLNYCEGHLAADAEKLLNSKIRHGYLVHLIRELPHDPSIDQTIARLREEKTIKVAFARFERGRKFVKFLSDQEIHESI
jgi:hypothetical protein